MPRRKKLLVWDGDNTLWNGIILNGDVPEMSKSRVALVEMLSDMGVLQSVASRNLLRDVESVLHQYGVSQHFLANQADLSSTKPQMLESIMSSLGLVRKTDLLFLDDDMFNVDDALKSGFDAVVSMSDDEILGLFSKDSYTQEDRNRVRMYRSELDRKMAGASYGDDRQAFLVSCDMRCRIRLAEQQDFSRVCDLVQRANQLSAAVKEFSTDELQRFLDDRSMYVLDAEDKYGPYGVSGVCVAVGHLIVLLTISCRLQGKGYGSCFLGWMLNNTAADSAQWIETEYNAGVRALYEWYKFDISKNGATCCASTSLTTQVSLPHWISIM